jgi:hypothetical protein
MNNAAPVMERLAANLEAMQGGGTPEERAGAARACLRDLRSDRPGIDYAGMRFEAMQAAAYINGVVGALILEDALDALVASQLRARHVAVRWLGVIGMALEGGPRRRIVRALTDELPACSGEVSGCSWAGAQPLVVEALRGIGTPEALDAIRRWRGGG